MDIEAIVKKHDASWQLAMLPSEFNAAMRAALTELSETHAIELRAYEATVENLEWRIRQLEAAQPTKKPCRCALCGYQHGHQIGCENNPVDIALRAAAPQPKKEGE